MLFSKKQKRKPHLVFGRTLDGSMTCFHARMYGHSTTMYVEEVFEKYDVEFGWFMAGSPFLDQKLFSDVVYSKSGRL